MDNRDKLYNLLVNQVPGIKERYKRKRSRVTGVGRIWIWLYLIGLNISYYIFRRKSLAVLEKYPYYERKEIYTKDSESSISSKKRPEQLAEELATYDVVSFDVFDTLILRPFSSPTDLFYVLGHEINYMDFQRIRMEMEWKARETKYKKFKSYEVNLEEIYTILSAETGLPKEATMTKELELEYEFCFANPYMQKVVEILREKGKRMIITSDMYLQTEQIKTILKRSGYDEFGSYYVSCDIQKSKSKGNLYDYVKEQEGKEKSFAHVGDNYVADVENPKKYGFDSFHYVNVNAVGEPYRPYDMSVITGSMYRGVVNAHIHNGLYKYSREYEYGYIYGGLFVTGYCQFIHQYIKEHGVDKILFLARDGKVLSKAYHLLYPEEDCNWEYVYWSRLAAVKMSARYHKYDYFRRFLYHKVNQNYTLRQILSSMELEDMLENLCEVLGVEQKTKLTDKNIEKVKTYLMKRWEIVLRHYAEQLEAGKQYYSKILKGCRKAAAVDIGWAGSGAVALDYVANQEWELDCEIIGIIAGTNSCHNAEPDSSETFLQSGKMVSYMYSQRENRDIWKLHDAGKGHNLYWEMLLDAPAGSFKGFYVDENGKYRCEFKEATADAEKIEDVQKGILEFVRHYKGVWRNHKALAGISGRDAYAPMVSMEVEWKNSDIYAKRLSLLDNANID